MTTDDHDAPNPKLAPHHTSEIGARATALDLVARYPELSGVELARLIDLYRRLSAVEIALMLSDETLGPKLHHFAKDQRREIRAPLRDYVFLLVFAVIGIAVTTWTLISGKI